MVGCNAVEPRIKTGLTRKGVESKVGFYKNLLDEVFGLLSVRYHRKDQPKEPVLVAFNQIPECVLVPLTRAFDEETLFVGHRASEVLGIERSGCSRSSGILIS